VNVPALVRVFPVVWRFDGFRLVGGLSAFLLVPLVRCGITRRGLLVTCPLGHLLVRCGGVLGLWLHVSFLYPGVAALFYCPWHPAICWARRWVPVGHLRAVAVQYASVTISEVRYGVLSDA